MGSTVDKTPKCDATAKELQQYDTALQRIKELDRSNTYDASDPDHRLVVLAFDGTRNDRDIGTRDPKYIHTNPDLLEGLVAWTDTVKPLYIHGVATRNDNYFESQYEALTGDGSEDRAETAYKKLVKQVQKWHDENPNVEIHVSTVGFSRGTGSQRHFANLVDDLGIPDPSGSGYLIPPGGVHQDVMLIYDSVVTGQEDVLNLGIPDSVKNVVHLTAEHDNRINFDSASIVDPLNPNDPGILQMGLAGAHSDVGGNYDYDGLSARSLALGHELLSLMGVPVTEIPLGNRPVSDNVTIHDSGSLIFPSDWEFGEREIDIYGNPERQPENITVKEKIVLIQGESAEETFLGLNEADWQDLNTIFAKVEQMEDFGDEISAIQAALGLVESAANASLTGADGAQYFFKLENLAQPQKTVSSFSDQGTFTGRTSVTYDMVNIQPNCTIAFGSLGIDYVGNDDTADDYQQVFQAVA